MNPDGSVEKATRVLLTPEFLETLKTKAPSDTNEVRDHLETLEYLSQQPKPSDH